MSAELLVPPAVARARRAARPPREIAAQRAVPRGVNASSYPRLLAGWLVAALAAGALGLPARLPAGVLALGFAWLAFGAAGAVVFHRGVRAWATALPTRALLAPHLVRFSGAWLLVLYGQGRLPAEFAVPVGLGELAAALGAGALLAWPSRGEAFRRVLRVWNGVAFAGVLAGGAAALRLALHEPGLLGEFARFPLCLLPLALTPFVVAGHTALLDRVAPRARATPDVAAAAGAER